MISMVILGDDQCVSGANPSLISHNYDVSKCIFIPELQGLIDTTKPREFRFIHKQTRHPYPNL